MMTATRLEYHLPRRDDLGFCNILMSALGGDGANMAAKLLFKIGVEQFGLDGGYDARYGSEKKGTATDVSVRFCEPGTPVRQSGPTNRPHYLVVFHTDLIRPLELNRGLHEGATCIINTRESPQHVRDLLQLPSGRVVCLNGSQIAHDCGSRPNMPMLAMLCHELEFPDELIRKIVAKQWPRAVDANLAAYARAVAEASSENFDDNGAYNWQAPAISRGPLGWRNMLNGGTIDALTHTTAGRDNRIAAQGRVPEFTPGACTSCGICLTVCSDPGGLQWREGKMTGVDAAFCKGCMRCVEVCPETKKGKALIAPPE